jgi:hypothetical protein
MSDCNVLRIRIGLAMIVAIVVGLVLNAFVGPEVYVPVQVAIFLGATA